MRTAKAAAAAAVGDGEGKARLAHGKGGRGLSHVGLVFFSLVWRGGGGGAGVLRENCEPVVISLHIARPRRTSSPGPKKKKKILPEEERKGPTEHRRLYLGRTSS